MLYQAIVITITLPLRAGPGDSYPMITSLAQGDTIEVTQTFSNPKSGDRWAFVRAGDRRGYVSMQCISKVNQED